MNNTRAQRCPREAARRCFVPASRQPFNTYTHRHNQSLHLPYLAPAPATRPSRPRSQRSPRRRPLAALLQSAPPRRAWPAGSGRALQQSRQLRGRRRGEGGGAACATVGARMVGASAAGVCAAAGVVRPLCRGREHTETAAWPAAVAAGILRGVRRLKSEGRARRGHKTSPFFFSFHPPSRRLSVLWAAGAGGTISSVSLTKTQRQERSNLPLSPPAVPFKCGRPSAAAARRCGAARPTREAAPCDRRH